MPRPHFLTPSSSSPSFSLLQLFYSDPESNLLEGIPSPFQPKVNKPRGSVVVDNGGLNSVGTFDRLYRAAAEREAHVEEKRLARFKTEMTECSFSPALNPARPSTAPAAQVGSSPFSRLYSDALERRLRTETFEAALPPVDTECTFEPALTVTSRRISDRMRSSPAAADDASATLPRHLQLYAEGLKKQRDRRDNAALIAAAGGLIRDADARECTFQPSSSKGVPTSPAALNSNVTPGSGGIHARLYEEALAKRAALVSLEAGLDADYQ